MKSRITRITAALLAAVLSLSLLAGCKPKKELTRYTTIFYDVFDTVTQVIAYCESEEEFNTQMQALHQDLIAYNQLYDIYNNYDGVVNVKTINENAGKAPVQVDDRILSMLELARQMYDLTGGKINIAMGSVLGIWHDYREAAEKDGKPGWKFTLHMPSYLPVMQYADDRSLRETLYRAFSTRASEFDGGKYDNTPLISEILRLRREEAALLGFADYAESSLATKMADTPAEVIAFLRVLRVLRGYFIQLGSSRLCSRRCAATPGVVRPSPTSCSKPGSAACTAGWEWK